MECQSRYISRVCEKYNRKHVTAFVRKNAEQRFLRPFHLSLASRPPASLSSCRDLLSRSEEFQLFIALHFMKYKIKKARQAKSRYITIYLALRNRAISGNWTLVLTCIESHNKYFSNSDPARLMEIGNMNLLNAVDCFDPWRGFRFCTYACNSILKGFISKRHLRLPAMQINEVLTDTLASKQQNNNNALWLERLHKLLDTQKWTKREKDILTHRFGCFGGEKLTLEDVAKTWNLTKERVRQIQVETLTKLKRCLSEDKILH